MDIIKKLWKILDYKQRRATFYMLFLTIVSMFLEILGISLVIPAITLLITDDITLKYPQLTQLIVFLGYPSHTQLVTFGMLSLIFVYLIKNLYLAFFSWYQSKFTFGLQVDISQRLYENYIKQPYLFHLRRNSAQLIRNIQDEVTNLQGAVQFIITLFVEFLIFGGIVVLLIYVEPLGALIAGSIIITVILAFSLITKKYFEIWGEEIQYHGGMAKQHLMQGLGGVKEVKLSGREKNFFSLYYVHHFIMSNRQILFNVSNALPRLLFELLALIGLVVVVILMVSLNSEMDTIISTLALFGMAAFRLMPSSNRIVASFQSLSYTKASIEILHSELELLKDNLEKIQDENLNAEKTKIKNGSVLSLDNVCFNYPLAQNPTLKNISFEIKQGETIGFIGPSGSGKTTLIDLILGLLKPDSGTIELNGLKISDFIKSWQNQIGYVPQSIYLTDDTLRNNIAFGLKKEEIDEVAINKAVKSSQLFDMVGELSDGLDTEVGERGVRLSGGQKQRLGIARALYHDPEILVLDEATSALDTETESSIVDSLKEIKGKKTILIIAHRQSTVKYCDKLIRINQGRIHDEEK